MTCPRCQHDNPQGARFCEECAALLARTCANCGTAVSATAKFCHACAHPVVAGAGTPSRSPDSYVPKHLAEKILTSKSALEGERKQVTVLFADLKGSMELLADRDPEEARKILDPILERMMEAVHRYEGERLVCGYRWPCGYRVFWTGSPASRLVRSATGAQASAWPASFEARTKLA
jgi:class 3 adenylate cyclase